MTERLGGLSAAAPNTLAGLYRQNLGYLKMALEPEIQRIVLRDEAGGAGRPVELAERAQGCVALDHREHPRSQEEGVIAGMDAEAIARLITGASTHAAQWIANSDDPEATSEKAVAAFQDDARRPARLRRSHPRCHRHPGVGAIADSCSRIVAARSELRRAVAMLIGRNDHAPVALLAGFVLLVLIVAGALWLVVRQDQAAAMVQHTLEVEGRLTNVLSRLQDAETGERGYLLTRQKPFLDPYRDATVSLEETWPRSKRRSATTPRSLPEPAS